jgi:thymidylate synthase (FAD)
MKFFGNVFVSLRQVFLSELSTEDEFLTHADVTVQFVVDRGISHELVRHRPASFAQESTRYCNYGKDKFGNQITFIIPEFFEVGSPEWVLWRTAMEECENT